MEISELPIFRPGSNCWKIAHAGRFRLLIDASEYYAALLDAVSKARDSIFILGWDLDSRVNLDPQPGKERPEYRLGEVLKTAALRSPRLRIRILCWDFAMIYSLEREFFQGIKWRHFSHPRISFEIDGKHPVGASHHQKIVCIDDRIAFVGGLDLCSNRWDTREHRPNEPRRRDSHGADYPPFHDVQALIEGEAARQLGMLARERWFQATGERAIASSESEDCESAWPDSVSPDLTGGADRHRENPALRSRLPRHPRGREPLCRLDPRSSPACLLREPVPDVAIDPERRSGKAFPGQSARIPLSSTQALSRLAGRGHDGGIEATAHPRAFSS